jgi:hypothetical protein
MELPPDDPGLSLADLRALADSALELPPDVEDCHPRPRSAWQPRVAVLPRAFASGCATLCWRPLVVLFLALAAVYTPRLFAAQKRPRPARIWRAMARRPLLPPRPPPPRMVLPWLLRAGDPVLEGAPPLDGQQSCKQCAQVHRTGATTSGNM